MSIATSGLFAAESISPDETRALEQVRLLFNSRDFGAAIPVINRIIVMRQWRSANRNETTVWFEELAFCLRQVKQYHAAAAILEKVHASYERFSETYPERILAHRNMALALAEAGDVDKALKELPTAAANAVSTDGVNSYAAAKCYSSWLACLRERERWSETIRVGERYLVDYGYYEPHDCRSQVIEILRSISHAYRKVKNYDRAVVFLELAVFNSRAKWGDVDRRTLEAQRWLARCMHCQGYRHEAMELLKYVHRTYLETLGAHHQNTMTVSRELKRRRSKLKQRQALVRRQIRKTRKANAAK